jgi:hypothetical protein
MSMFQIESVRGWNQLASKTSRPVIELSGRFLIVSGRKLEKVSGKSVDLPITFSDKSLFGRRIWRATLSPAIFLTGITLSFEHHEKAITLEIVFSQVTHGVELGKRTRTAAKRARPRSSRFVEQFAFAQLQPVTT